MIFIINCDFFSLFLLFCYLYRIINLKKKKRFLQFNEPGGLYVYDNNLYVADTNNHEIMIINLKSKETSKVSFSVLFIFFLKNLLLYNH